MTRKDLKNRRSAIELAATTFGCVLVAVALLIVWAARISVGRDLYVSALGADDVPTAGWFRLALTLVAIGATFIASSVRGLSSTQPILRLWRPAVSLWFSSAFFLVAAQVPCTPGCPAPYGATFTWQDLTHTSAAVLAFALACWGMLQLSFAAGRRAMSILSLASGIAVAGIAAAGGIISLLKGDTDFGSRLELVATTIAIAWLVTVGIVSAVRLRWPDESQQNTASSRHPALAEQ